jgi:hypothetical protein
LKRMGRYRRRRSVILWSGRLNRSRREIQQDGKGERRGRRP